jgi:hypothetical protein
MRPNPNEGLSREQRARKALEKESKMSEFITTTQRLNMIIDTAKYLIKLETGTNAATVDKPHTIRRGSLSLMRWEIDGLEKVWTKDAEANPDLVLIGTNPNYKEELEEEQYELDRWVDWRVAE